MSFFFRFFCILTNTFSYISTIYFIHLFHSHLFIYIVDRELEIVQELLEEVLKCDEVIGTVCTVCAELDCLLSFVAASRQHCMFLHDASYVCWVSIFFLDSCGSWRFDAENHWCMRFWRDYVELDQHHQWYDWSINWPSLLLRCWGEDQGLVHATWWPSNKSVKT